MQFSTVAEAGSQRSGCQPGWGLGWGPSSGRADGCLWLYVDKEEKEKERSFSSYKDTYYLHKDLIFKCNHNEGLGLQHTNFGGDTNI